MIKTSAISQTNHLDVSIPDSYIGKELEVLIYAKDEISTEKIKPAKNAASYKGLFTAEEGEAYHNYLKQARSEWDRDI